MRKAAERDCISSSWGMSNVIQSSINRESRAAGWASFPNANRYRFVPTERPIRFKLAERAIQDFVDTVAPGPLRRRIGAQHGTDILPHR